jgi:hypothetical protein
VRNSVLLYSNPNFPFPDTQKRPRMPAHELAPALPSRRVVRVFLISCFLKSVISQKQKIVMISDGNDHLASHFIKFMLTYCAF